MNLTTPTLSRFMYGYELTSKRLRYTLANRQPSNILASVIDELNKLPTQSHVLDLGCGDGMLESHTPSNRSYSFTSIDIEPAAIKKLEVILKSKYPHKGDEAIINDIRHLQHLDTGGKKFNSAISWRVLHGIAPQYYGTIFQDVYALLKPKSSFFVAVASDKDWKVGALGEKYNPAGVNDCAGIMFRDEHIARERPFPVHFFSIDELVQLGLKHKFTATKIKTFKEPSGYKHLQANLNTYHFVQFIKM